MILEILATILILIADWQLFKKMGREGWEGIIPLYNNYVLCEEMYYSGWKQRCTRGYKRYKETSGLIEWKECQIFHSIFT